MKKENFEKLTVCMARIPTISFSFSVVWLQMRAFCTKGALLGFIGWHDPQTSNNCFEFSLINSINHSYHVKLSEQDQWGMSSWSQSSGRLLAAWGVRIKKLTPLWRKSARINSFALWSRGRSHGFAKVSRDRQQIPTLALLNISDKNKKILMFLLRSSPFLTWVNRSQGVYLFPRSPYSVKFCIAR